MKNQRTKIIFIIALVYLSLSLFVLWWMFSSVEKTGQEMSAQAIILADNMAQEREVGDLSRLVDASFVVRSQLEEFVLAEAETVNFLADIELIGNEQGVKLETSSLEVIDSGGEFPILLVDFSIIGYEKDALKMIKILENIPYHSELRSITFDRNPDNESLVLISTTLAVSMNR